MCSLFLGAVQALVSLPQVSQILKHFMILYFIFIICMEAYIVSHTSVLILWMFASTGYASVKLLPLWTRTLSATGTATGNTHTHTHTHTGNTTRKEIITPVLLIGSCVLVTISYVHSCGKTHTHTHTHTHIHTQQ
eukprot:GHVR01107155.1.p1 GENE.GHVR01107155.1~~GHVR01107155.1.p1  ORF type:complete len:156 (+),score=65.47 GHVR01107155.1:64-468(+)